MVRESELKSIRQFVRGQLRAEQDLSSLTLGILKRRYLATVGSDALSASAKSLLKQVVEQELIEMQENKSGDESEAEDVQNKRKRERENDIASESENEVASKRIKSSRRVSSESESEDEESNTTESVRDEEEEQSKTGSGGEKQEIRKSPEKKNGKCEEDSEDGETEMETNMAKKKTRQSGDDDDDDDDDESNSKKNDSSQSSDESEKENVAEKTTNQADSDSSSLPSLEDEQELKTKENKVKQKKEKDQNGGKKKSSKKEKDSPAKKQKEDDKAVVRLKRYISLCGEKRNYKKLLGECRSVRSMSAVLKKELEDLGVHGQPSIKKCKKVRLKKEEARELAELDLSNIIDSQGRPKRRGAFAQQRESARRHALPRPPSSVSDGEEENNVQQVQRRMSNWANLKGIISDDADSD
ncbi:HIRA-interacting protein 3 isoform X3 [Hippocampus comes]|uniref:HIRA-interacting protein 3 isoform X3 n=1 Tax=Hippocampus comes TaxID=109280 RepID=UPI00094E215F|nr:PREDICTED: HIRA-interacting protein 3 isoform X3 [Hippocampus comes]